MKTFRQDAMMGALGLGVGVLASVFPSIKPAAPANTPARAITLAAAREPSREEAVRAAASALANRGMFRELAQLGEMLAGLDAGQLAMLADWIDGMRSSEREILLPRFIAYWTRRDAPAATAWMKRYRDAFAQERWFGSGFATFETHLVAAWADNAPELAFEYASKHAGTGLSGIIIANAIHRWPDKDDLHRFEVLRSFPAGKDRQKAMISFCFSWAQTDRTGALAAVKTLPAGPEREGALCEILANFAYNQPAFALQQAMELGLSNVGALGVIVKEAAKGKPAVAAEWLVKNSPALVPDLGVVVAQSWAGKDPVAAFQWATEHGIPLTESTSRAAGKMLEGVYIGHRMELGGESPLASAIRDKPEATVAWLRSLPAGVERDRYMEYAISRTADMKVLQPLLSQLTGEAATNAAGKVAASLYYKDPEAARRWAESLPAGAARTAAWAKLGAQRTEPLDVPQGADRDAMLSGMATGQYYSTPVKSLERALQIENPALRRQTFDDVMAFITRGDVEIGYNAKSLGLPPATLEKVQEWLTTANVPEDWKQAWQQSLQ